LTTCYYKI